MRGAGFTHAQMTFLFDIGRVILDFEFESRLLALFPPGCPDAAARIEALMERKDEFEAGRIGVDAFFEWAVGVVGYGITSAQLRLAWQDIFTPNEPMWPVIERLAADGHRLLLFSNTSGIHCPWVMERYAVFEHFHGAVLSFETGFVKPEDGIFHHALSEHALDPRDTAYIDDLPQNIEAGQRFGFHCWLYDSRRHADFEAWLECLLAGSVSDFNLQSNLAENA